MCRLSLQVFYLCDVMYCRHSAAIYIMVAKFWITIRPPPPQLSLQRRAVLSSNSNGTRSVPYIAEREPKKQSILWDVYMTRACDYLWTVMQYQRVQFVSVVAILLRGIQLTDVQHYWGTIVKIVLSYTIFAFHEANTCAALPNAWRRSVRALSYSVITTIMDQKVQLVKSLNKRELNTT
jgi:hypothetical protein